MADFIDTGAVKVIEIIGISPDGFEAAIDNAVAKAAESIAGITGVEVQNLSARVDSGKVVEYRANVKLAFAVR
ncbi:MAG: dodecin family protein [Actinomycetota bacterium]|nr:dodecin family protein [Actinomycetota bacterium]